MKSLTNYTIILRPTVTPAIINVEVQSVGLIEATTPKTFAILNLFP